MSNKKSNRKNTVSKILLAIAIVDLLKELISLIKTIVT